MKRYLQYIRNTRGQGTTEYIIILAIAVALAVTIFWKQLRDPLNTKVAEISENVTNAGKPD